ncbi:alanine racemase [Sphingomonas sp. S1-29]|uniref:alanine racemase n=1 Tax=Sphingomonas sp. S1-29 TaxID=2991074 RepID=UPI0022401A7A|nr:alanine racemase [Sphingomonas sp. S1-29]UZK68802.1 alanine racemase [Sphingomonas sp. S1-29]
MDCHSYSSELVIDLDAIRANYRSIQRHVAASDCAAVVKADAYGLGAPDVAKALYNEGCRIFFVAQLCEAMEVHGSLPTNASIIILNGLDPGSENICADSGFVPVLNSESQVQHWRSLARARNTALPAALQVDTGMSRLGLSALQLQALAEDASLFDDVQLRLIMTHLACADDPGSPVNARQLREFHDLARLLPTVPRSIANSCAIGLSSDYHLEISRAGIGLYGLPPPNPCPKISPVIKLTVRVLQIRELKWDRASATASPIRRRICVVWQHWRSGTVMAGRAA